MYSAWKAAVLPLYYTRARLADRAVAIGATDRKPGMVHAFLTNGALHRAIMYHDLALASQSTADPRPVSAVSAGAGLAGLAGLLGWLGIAAGTGWTDPIRRWSIVAACAVAMAGWSLLVDKVHRSPTTGIDWSAPRAVARDARHQPDQARGLLGDLGGDGADLRHVRFYWAGNFQFAMSCFTVAAPLLFVASIPYMLWLDRYLVEPQATAPGRWARG